MRLRLRLAIVARRYAHERPHTANLTRQRGGRGRERSWLRAHACPAQVRVELPWVYSNTPSDLVSRELPTKDERPDRLGRYSQSVRYSPDVEHSGDVMVVIGLAQRFHAEPSSAKTAQLLPRRAPIGPSVDAWPLRPLRPTFLGSPGRAGRRSRGIRRAHRPSPRARRRRYVRRHTPPSHSAWWILAWTSKASGDHRQRQLPAPTHHLGRVSWMGGKQARFRQPVRRAPLTGTGHRAGLAGVGGGQATRN